MNVPHFSTLLPHAWPSVSFFIAQLHQLYDVTKTAARPSMNVQIINLWPGKMFWLSLKIQASFLKKENPEHFKMLGWGWDSPKVLVGTESLKRSGRYYLQQILHWAGRCMTVSFMSYLSITTMPLTHTNTYSHTHTLSLSLSLQPTLMV